MHNAKPRCKKNRECLRQLYEANHLYLMKWHLSRHEPGTKLSPSNQQWPTARERQTETAEKAKIKIGTHLTVIGVCTTIRPETSGT
jgi:hypothetical protein